MSSKAKELTMDEAVARAKRTKQAVYGSDGKLLVHPNGVLSTTGRLKWTPTSSTAAPEAPTTTAIPTTGTPITGQILPDSGSYVDNKDVTKSLKSIFPDKGIQKEAQGAYNLYNELYGPQFEQSQLFNYQLPTAETDPTLAKLKGDFMNSGVRTPEAQHALDLLRTQADQTNFNDPALMEAFNARRALALGESNPIAVAQRDSLNQSLTGGLQTALRNARGIGLGAGLGGANPMAQRAAIQDFGQQYQTGLTNLQLGNLNSYQDLASQVDANNYGRRLETSRSYADELGKQTETQNAEKGASFNRYNTRSENDLNRYFTLGGIDRNRRDTYQAGRLASPYYGAAYGEQRAGRKGSEKYMQQMMEIQKSLAAAPVPSFGPTQGTSESFQTKA